MKRKITAKKKNVRSRDGGMYVYLYDTFVTEKKYQADLARIETRLSQLGLQGRIEKLSILKNVQGIVRDAVRKGAQTLVVVGNDETITKVISLIASEALTLGIIPIGPHQESAGFLGIPPREAACDVLSRRIVRSIDLGRVNDAYFLFSLEIPKAQTQLECDNQYVVSPMDARSAIRICNLGVGTGAHGAAQRLCNPQDGILEAIVESAQRPSFFRAQRRFADSVFPIRKARIHSPTASLPLLLDGRTVVKTPATVEVAPGRLRVIVGRDRKFA